MDNVYQRGLHVICERDVGLFSLVQQVIANIPWAKAEGRIPLVFFQSRTAYWTPRGYQNSDSVWEYYFEPVVSSWPVAKVPNEVKAAIHEHPPEAWEVGFKVPPNHFVTSNFGDHGDLAGKALSIPYLWMDPSDELRQTTSALIAAHVRPRAYLRSKTNQFATTFFRQNMIGVHIRGTDAISDQETRAHRKDSLHLPNYAAAIERMLVQLKDAAIFVATDDAASLRYMRECFESRVVAYPSLRHDSGDPAGVGPTGWIMPAYVTQSRDLAARNGEEAIIEYLLLSGCKTLVHNGSSLARTVLLKEPDLPHINTRFVSGTHSLSEGEEPDAG